jgi:ACS family hexuronate transporter-like MFS transporter
MPRFLIARHWGLNQARKTTMLLMTCLMPAFCLLATQVSGAALAVTVVAGMMFCHAGWGNMTLPAEVFPKNAVGTITGLGGACGSLMSALSQHCIGHVVDAYGFTPIFIACAGLYPLAMILVQVLVGQLGVTRKI